MRHLFKAHVFFSSLLLALVGALSTSAQARSSRADAVQASYELYETALDLADEVRRSCNCPNTQRTLGELADAASELEIAARFDTRQQATARLKNVIRSLRDLRPYLANMSNTQLRQRIKRELLLSINSAGQAVMDSAWIAVYSCSGDDACSVDAQLDVVEDNLNGEVHDDF